MHDAEQPQRQAPTRAPDDFPHQFGSTRRFTLGVPKAFTVSPDGKRVLFLRSVSGTDPRSVLWLRQDGRERRIAGPRPDGSAGVSGYATDRAVRLVAYTDGVDALWTVSVDTVGEGRPARRIPTVGVPVDPRPSPDGTLIAYVSDGALRVVRADGSDDRALATPEHTDITYGLTDHTAHESIGRTRAYWWAPDSRALLVARVDPRPVRHLYVADAACPDRPPRTIRYPSAGTSNSLTTLGLYGVDGGHTAVDLPVEVPAEEAPDSSWGRAFEYLVSANWDSAEPLVCLHSRDQRTLWTLRVSPHTGRCVPLSKLTDPHWADPVHGTPVRTASGALVVPAVRGDVTTVRIGDTLGPAGLQVREVLGVDGEQLLFTATALTEPTETHVWTHHPAHGFSRLSDEPGDHTATVGGDTLVLAGETTDGRRVTIRRAGRPAGEIEVLTAPSVVPARPAHLALGARRLRSRLHLPSWHRPGMSPLPVLMSPYGGPGLQVVAHGDNWWHPLTCQWYAEQGFAVLATDGRGTPGRGREWLRAILGDRLSPVLQDQTDALHAAADLRPGTLDLSRVGVQGWSFGGYLAIGAVLRHPETFHVAVAGAAPTDRRLYDTYWEERYLGHPEQHPDGYAHDDLVSEAHRLTRPLLLLHGLADTNVLPAHTLRLSAALHAAGRPHSVHLLPGTAHHPGTPELTTSVLRLQQSFLTTHLRPDAPEN